MSGHWWWQRETGPLKLKVGRASRDFKELGSLGGQGRVVANICESAFERFVIIVTRLSGRRPGVRGSWCGVVQGVTDQA